MLLLKNCQKTSSRNRGYQYDWVSDKYRRNSQRFSPTNKYIDRPWSSLPHLSKWSQQLNVVSKHHFSHSTIESVDSFYSVYLTYHSKEWIWENENSNLSSIYFYQPYCFLAEVKLDETSVKLNETWVKLGEMYMKLIWVSKIFQCSIMWFYGSDG